MNPSRSIARIAVPVSLEMVVQLGLNLLVQLVVGLLGALSLAAVGFVNSLVLVVMVTLATLGTAAAILAARAHGAGDTRAVATVATAASTLALVFTLALCVPVALASDAVLAALGASPDIARAGAGYFTLTLLSLPFLVHGAVTSNTFRSIGHARTPMTVAMLSAVLNGTLAWALVVGAGPLPALGLIGAACAGLTAQVVKAALLFWLLHFRLAHVPLSWPASARAWQVTARQLLVLAFPLAITQLSWSGGAFLYTLLFARLSTAALAASQIVLSLEGLFIVASYGLPSAATTLIGHAVGARDPERARQWARTLMRVGVVTGVVFGALFWGASFALPHLYANVGAETLHVAFWGVALNAAFQVVKVRNMILGGGVLPSGGDTRGVVIGDLIGPFLVGLPLAYLLAFPLGLGVWGVFWGRIADEVVKASFFTWRVRRVRWEALVPPRAEPGAQQAA